MLTIWWLTYLARAGLSPAGIIDLARTHTPLASKADMEIIRTATNKAWVLGNDRFKAKVEKILNRQVQQKPRGGIGGLKYLRVNRVSIESDPIGSKVKPPVCCPDRALIGMDA